MNKFGLASILLCLAGLMCIILGSISASNSGLNTAHIPIAAILVSIGMTFFNLSVKKQR